MPETGVQWWFVFIPLAHPPPLQRNKQFVSLLMCLSLRIYCLLKPQARPVKDAGLGGGMGEQVQLGAYLPLS